MNDSLIEKKVQEILTAKLVIVIREKTYQKALLIAEATISAGAQVLEITWTTPQAFSLIKTLRAKYSQLIIGAGTVCDQQTALEALNAGAQFLVSPHFETQVFQICKADQLYIPGIMTPLEGHRAHNYLVQKYKTEHVLLKLFPAKFLGPKYVGDVLKPYPKWKLMPSGGVDLETIDQWFQAGVQAVSVGSVFSGLNDSEAIISLTKKYLEKIQLWKQKFL